MVPTGAQTVGTPESTSPYETETLAGIELFQATVAPKAATPVVRRSEIVSANVAGMETAVGRGGTPPAAKPAQLIERAFTEAVTCLSAAYDAFGCPSGQNTPDCQPARSRSSYRWKLK